MADPTWTVKRCTRCGVLVKEDPALTVECPDPQCYAPVGEPCRGIDGHSFQGNPPHKARTDLAARKLTHCTGVMNDGDTNKDG